MSTTRQIAVMMGLDQPYERHIGVFAGIHAYAQQQPHWRLIVDDWADRLLPTRPGPPMPFDGLLGRITRMGATRADRLGLPAVNVWFQSPVRHRLPGVFPDYAEAGRLRADHLLARGFRHFGVLRREGNAAGQVEADAFEEALRQSDCESVSRVEIGVDTGHRMGIDQAAMPDHRAWQRAVRAIDRWMDTWSRPIGLFVSDVPDARVLIEKCLQRGWHVPEDVAIIAGWNEQVLCERPAPSITSVEMNYEKIGYEAARLLDERLNHVRTHRLEAIPLKHITLPPVGIIARQSTGFHAVDDDLVRQALRYLDTHAHRSLLIDEMARHIGVSRRKLENRFRSSVGRTLAGELRRLRVERAKRELTTSDQPIHQVAAAVGFTNLSTFNSTFRQALGCTPREFRQRAARAAGIERSP